ncbi:10722_t:CDS:2 [Paraglomus brasilianum]|uniref:10722_t:CDS:1 n=1 Tax=Paraglomus brasilianum TaxID=144538 RepID=A0A9N8WCJ1_9GLOM|nr:10722_t:CDS:2 [Paraglomus brasilianum]
MRISYHLISLAILVSSVFVSAGPAPDNNGNTCSSCWVSERNKLPQCQNVPQSEISEFSKLTDEEIIAKKGDFPKLIPCLCALVPKVPTILDECNCNSDDATALTKEDGSYDNSTPTNTTGSDPNPVPLASAAISAQWAGSFIVTLGAVVIALAL